VVLWLLFGAQVASVKLAAKALSRPQFRRRQQSVLAFTACLRMRKAHGMGRLHVENGSVNQPPRNFCDLRIKYPSKSRISTVDPPSVDSTFIYKVTLKQCVNEKKL
jgi:hypothetical protein